MNMFDETVSPRRIQEENMDTTSKQDENRNTVDHNLRKIAKASLTGRFIKLSIYMGR